MKITPFHPSLEQPSGKQEGERKSLFQFMVQKQMEFFNDQNSTNTTGNRHHFLNSYLTKQSKHMQLFSLFKFQRLISP